MDAAAEGFASRPVVLIIALALFTLLPFVLMMTTSYVKLVVVFHILRNALGTQQVPPNAVIAGLALILTVYVMSPTIEECRTRAGPLLELESEQDLLSRQSADLVLQTVEAVKEPLRGFLERNAAADNVEMFLDLARKRAPSDEAAERISEGDFLVLVPAFVVTELTEAFLIGFVLFLPFLVIELTVSNVLLSLGMHMLSPTQVSLPFKLLLFVAVSGWQLLAHGLVMGYA
jgi:type III secretion protein R